MQIGTTGIVVDQRGQVLLIRRNDTRTWAPPGGALDANELPLDGAIREVEEETGLTVLPIRLAGVYFWPMSPDGFLTFVFRCLPQSGELTSSFESPELGFVPSNKLPSPMLKISRERIEGALAHVEQRPLLIQQPFTLPERAGMFALRNIIYRYYDYKRKSAGTPSFAPPVSWTTGAFAVIQNEAGAVLWVKRTDKDVWNLPGGGSDKMEPPWKTAVRETLEETGLTITIDGLTGVYQFAGRDNLVFVFMATVQSGTLTTGFESADFGWFTSGEEPENRFESHVERVADALSPSAITQFRMQGNKVKAGK